METIIPITRSQVSEVAKELVCELKELIASQAIELKELKAEKENRLLKGVEVAKRLGVTSASITKMRKMGYLKAVYVNRSEV